MLSIKESYIENIQVKPTGVVVVTEVFITKLPTSALASFPFEFEAQESGYQELSRDYAERTINPGDDYSEERESVRMVCSLAHSKDFLVACGQVVDDKPDWDKFNLFILTDPDFSVYYTAGLQTSPLVTTSLPTALSQVASNGPSAFRLTFTTFCAQLGVSWEHRLAWAEAAVEAHLPADFVAIIKGIED